MVILCSWIVQSSPGRVKGKRYICAGGIDVVLFGQVKWMFEDFVNLVVLSLVIIIFLPLRALELYSSQGLWTAGQ